MKFKITNDWEVYQVEQDDPKALSSEEIINKVNSVNARLVELDNWMDAQPTLRREKKCHDILYLINDNLEIVSVVFTDLGTIEECEKTGSFSRFDKTISKNESICLRDNITQKSEKIRRIVNEKKTQTK